MPIGPQNSRYTPIPTYRPNVPNFNSNEAGTFENIPSLDSLGPSVNLDPRFQGQANRIPQFPQFNAGDPTTYQSIPSVGNLGTGTNLPNDLVGSAADDYQAPGSGPSLLGKDGLLIPGLNTLSGLSAAYTGLEQLDLSKDAFSFNKALTQRNLSNQATVTNNAIEDRSRAAAVQRGESTSNLDSVVAHNTSNRRVRGTL